MKDEFTTLLGILKKYNPKNPEYIKEKIHLLDNVEKSYDRREIIINAFKSKIFPLKYEQTHFEDEDKDVVRDENNLNNYKKLDRLISLKERDINDELVRKHFLVQNLGALLKKLRKLKNTEKNRIQVNLVRSGLRDLKEEFLKMDEDEKETEKSNEIVNLVKTILQFNNQNQEGKGLKILTLDQMISRLLIL